MNKSIALAAFRQWLPLAFGLTVLCGAVYVSVQQNMRQSANTPQIQMAEDGAGFLEQGVAPALLVRGGGMVDMRKSLSPYFIVFSATGTVLASNVSLDGNTPVPPAGVFEYAKKHGEDRITWQPDRGVRSAIVIKSYEGKQPGFVLAGRSLREVEERTGALAKQVALAWIVALLGTFVIAAYFAFAARPAPAPDPDVTVL